MMGKTASPRSRPLNSFAAIIGLWITGRASYLGLANFSALAEVDGASHHGQISAPALEDIQTLDKQRTHIAAKAAQSAGITIYSGDQIYSPTDNSFHNNTSSKPVPVHAFSSGTRQISQDAHSLTKSQPVVANDHLDSPVNKLNAVSGAPQMRGPKLIQTALTTTQTAIVNPPSTPLLLEGEGMTVPHARRFGGSSWALIRAGRAPVLADSGSLGASQAGMRVHYDIRRDGQLSVTGRISTPLAEQPGKEVAIGIAFKPVHDIPVQIIAERRIALDHGGRNGFEMLAAGGVYDHPLPGNLIVNGYVEAGLVGETRTQAFADGAMEVEHRLVSAGSTRLSAGAGAWASVQTNIDQATGARVDVGPEAAVRTVLGRVSVRLEASYRLRIAGKVRPSSGPALTLGTDF